MIGLDDYKTPRKSNWVETAFKDYVKIDRQASAIKAVQTMRKNGKLKRCPNV